MATPIPRDNLSDAEAVALLDSRELTDDLKVRLAQWVLETAKQEVAGRTYNYVMRDVAAFARAHSPAIESLPSKIN